MRKLWMLGLVAACLGAGGANCIPVPNPKGPREAGLRRFSSADELRIFLADQAIVRIAPRQSTGLGGLFSFLGGGFAPMAANVGDTTAEGFADGKGGATDGFSTTNIQELGVDESDQVKNDGQTIYVLDRDVVHIVKATPPESVAEVATVNLPSQGSSLYLRNNTLIALSQRYEWYGWEDVVYARNSKSDLVGGSWSDGSQTTITVIDVTDPAHPTTKTTLKLEGSLVSSRLIDNKLHVIMTTTPRLPDNPTSQAVRDMTLEQWLPDYQMVKSTGATKEGDIAGWDGFYRPTSPCGYGITTVVTINVDDPDADFKSTAISADAEVIYASTKALYITDTNYDWESLASVQDTIIHKLVFTGQGVDYVASGSVPGRPLNQYSLGEFEDYLRIATTLDAFGSGINQTSNSVYVLGESTESSETQPADGTSGTDGTPSAPLLKVVGKVENMAPGERIYAARFLGSRGFLVTFRRVDPLFTMNLSDPANPRVVGQLKVPGYSDHIQLMDENHLLTIGKDAQDAGSFAWIQGVQLSIFDVTDMAKPRLLHKEIIGGRGTDSEANRDPKAFNYFAPLNALAFPIDLYDGDTTGPEMGSHTFAGLLVYRVTVENGFEPLGRIASTEGADPRGCFWGYFGLTRGVFIGNTVYSATQTGVKAASLSLDDVSTLVGKTTFASHGDTITGCYGDLPLIAPPAGAGVQ